MRLVSVEVRRLLARRLFRVMVALAFLAVAVTLGMAAYQSHPPSAAQRAQAEQQAADVRRQQPPLKQQLAQCEEAKKGGNGPPADVPCSEVIHEPQASDFLTDRTFRFHEQVTNGVTGFAVLLALLGFLVGASFAGAEWSAGTMASLLTWEPRRLRVLATKALALALGLAVVGTALLGTYLLAAYGVAAWRGETSGATQGFVLSNLLTALRGVCLGVGAGLGGLALAGILRSTSAVLGLGFAYFMGAELLLRGVWKGSPPWLLTSNVGAWMIRNFHIDTFKCPPQGGECTQISTRVSQLHGALFLAALVAAMLAVWAVSFRRRDVT